MRKLLATLFVSLLLLACESESGPALVASNVQVFLPLPGSHAAVAYFTLENRSLDTIEVRAISSPQFGVAEIHETTLKDGVAGMRAVERLALAADSSVSLEPGGLHLMLMQPLEQLTIDASVTLQVHYDEAGLMIIDARAKSRSANQ